LLPQNLRKHLDPYETLVGLAPTVTQDVVEGLAVAEALVPTNKLTALGEHYSSLGNVVDLSNLLPVPQFFIKIASLSFNEHRSLPKLLVLVDEYYFFQDSDVSKVKISKTYTIAHRLQLLETSNMGLFFF